MAGPSLMATLGANISPFVSKLGEAKSQAAAQGESIASALGEKLTGALAAFGSIEFLKHAVGEAADYASKIEDIHLRLDVSREALQAWDLVLKQNGSSVEAAVKFFEKLAIAREKALGGDKESIAHFADFGVDLKELGSKRLQDIGLDVGAAFENGDPQKLIASLRAVGGKGAGELVASFRSGDFAGQIEEAMFGGMSDRAVKELDKAGDAVTRSKSKFRALVGETSGDFLSRMRDFGDLFSGKLGFKDFMLNRGDRLREARQGPEKAPFTDTGEDDQKPGKKALAEQEKERVGINKLREDMAKAQEKDRLDQMSDEERLTALTIKRHGLHIASVASKDEKERLTAGIKYLDVLGQEDKLREQIEKKGERDRDKANTEATKEAFSDKRMNYEVNALMRTGGVVGTFSASNEIAMTDVLKESNTHLAEIRKDIKTLVFQRGEPIPDDVTF